MPSNPAQSKQQKARALAQAGKLVEARTLYDKLCKQNPGDAEAWLMQGLLHGQLGSYVEAEACFRKVLTLYPQHAEAYDNLGAALYSQGKLDEAVESYRQAIRIQPAYAKAHYNLAVGLKAQGLLNEAVAGYQQVLRLKPDFVAAYVNLAVIYMEIEWYQEASKVLYTALQLSPNMPEIYLNLSKVLDGQGRYEEALSILQEAEQMDADNVDFVAAKAWILQRKGEKKAAYQIVRGQLEAGKRNPTIAIVLANLCKDNNCCEEAVKLLEDSLAQPGLNIGKLRGLHFALGKLYDGMQKFDVAFTHFKAANALNPYHFDQHGHAKLIDEIVAVYSRDALRTLPRGSNASERPVFIVGMPRSGTTLVEQILASHSAVYGAGELSGILNIVESLPASVGSGVAYPHCINSLTQAVADKLAAGYLDSLTELTTSAARVTNKMPNNFLYLGLIELLFPMARVIHCQRNPLDTCLSIYSLQFNANHPYADDLTYLGFYYREYQRLMRHWRSVLTIPVLEVCYEELIADQEKITRSILDFCGLDWDERCLRFHESGRSVPTLSYDQVRQPLYSKSVGRWKHYEPHLAPLKAALQPEGSEL